MEVQDKHILISVFVLLVVLGYTIWNINHFMPIIATCEDEFAIINECSCMPAGSTLGTYFNNDKYYCTPEELNLYGLSNG